MKPWVKPGQGGRGLRLKAGELNATEAAYEREVLAPAKERGEVLAYWFEGVTFRIAQDVRYTPDFLVHAADGYLEVHEVKGQTSKKGKCEACGGTGKFTAYEGPFGCAHCKGKGKTISGTRPYLEPQDRIRLRTFAEKFPFRVRAVWQRRKYEGGGWGHEDFTAWEEGAEVYVGAALEGKP